MKRALPEAKRGPAAPRTTGYGRPPPPTRLQRFSRLTSYLAVLSWVVVVIAVVVDAAVGPGPNSGPNRQPNRGSAQVPASGTDRDPGRGTSAGTAPGGVPDAPAGGVPALPARPQAGVRAAREPVRLEIPAMGVDTSLGRAVRGGDALRAARAARAAGVRTAGRMAPEGTNEPITGWHRLTSAAGTRPGTRAGTLVIGHVDPSRRSAVAGRFGMLRAGDTARIVRGDGTTAEFRIDSIERVRAGRFPVDRVYGPSGRPGIRLVSLAGRSDRRGARRSGIVIAYGHASRR